MGSLHWGRSREWRQMTRFERYADDSWMALLALPFRCWIAVKGRIGGTVQQNGDQ